MAYFLDYTHPATGNIETFSFPTPSLDVVLNGDLDYPDLVELKAVIKGTVPSVGTIASRNVETRLNLYGRGRDLFLGGPGTPPGDLNDQLARLTADVAAEAASLTVDRYATDLSGTSENFIVASRPMLLMHRLPRPGESIWTAGVTNCAAEVVLVDSDYTGSTTVGIGAAEPVTARKAGAVLVPLTCPVTSYSTGGLGYGLVYELEKPAAASSVEGEQHTGALTIDVTFDVSPHQRDTAGTFNNRTGYGVVSHYALYVLKLGESASVYAPGALPEQAQPSQYTTGSQVDAVFAINSANLTITSGVATVGVALNRYWSPTDNALTAIAAGTYFVGVVAQNQATRNRDIRMSDVAWSDAVVVASL